MTSYALPTVHTDIGTEQRELILIQATAQVVCCTLDAVAKSGDLHATIGEPDHPEEPYRNLAMMIQVVKRALAS